MLNIWICVQRKGVKAKNSLGFIISYPQVNKITTSPERCVRLTQIFSHFFSSIVNKRISDCFGTSQDKNCTNGSVNTSCTQNISRFIYFIALHNFDLFKSENFITQQTTRCIIHDVSSFDNLLISDWLFLFTTNSLISSVKKKFRTNMTNSIH